MENFLSLVHRYQDGGTSVSDRASRGHPSGRHISWRGPPLHPPGPRRAHHSKSKRWQKDRNHRAGWRNFLPFNRGQPTHRRPAQPKRTGRTATHRRPQIWKATHNLQQHHPSRCHRRKGLPPFHRKPSMPRPHPQSSA